MITPKILILGSARHGKDTVAEMINKHAGLTFESSSVAAARIFIYEKLKQEYGYQTPMECFNDRVNRRKEWHDLICDFNKDNKATLAKEILKESDMYVGMRSDAEIEECVKQELFDMIIGVYNPRLPVEDKSSFNIDLWKRSDFVITNAGTLEELEHKVEKIISWFIFNNAQKLLKAA